MTQNIFFLLMTIIIFSWLTPFLISVVSGVLKMGCAFIMLFTRKEYIQVPVEKIVYKEKIVKVPEIRTVYKEVPKEKVVYKDKIKEVRVEVPKERIIYKEIPVEKLIYKDIIKEVRIEVPKETTIIKKSYKRGFLGGYMTGIEYAIDIISDIIMHNQYSNELIYILKDWINDEQDRINNYMKKIK